MFQYANLHRDALRKRFLDNDGIELQVPIAGAMRPVHFTEVHRDDLRAVLAAASTDALEESSESV